MIEYWRHQSEKAFKKSETILKKLKTKRGHELDLLADKTHEKVFQKIDCLDCANCCTSIPPIVSQTDQKRIASHLNLSISDFHSKYLITDEDGDTVMNASPCPFLASDNSCKIYEFRPTACRAYPHTDHNQFSSNLSLHKINIRYCPAVFHIVERISQIVK